MATTRLTILLPAIMFAAYAAPGLSQSCEFYRNAETRLELFDLPDTGRGLAVAILPAGSSACIVESQTDNFGHSWDRVKFYLFDKEKVEADGWLSGGSEDANSAAEPVEAALPEPTTPAAAASPAAAATGDEAAFFANHWSLDADQSSFSFLSTKKGTVTEVHRFDRLAGSIDPDGTATVEIDLQSVNSGVDIRDVRMRFLLFQIDDYPKATITAKIDPASLAQLWGLRRMTYDLPVAISLHGQQTEMVVPVVISRLGGDLVSVASQSPVLVNVADFAMQDGVAQLAEAVGSIVISPIAPVSFNLTFVAGPDG